MTMMPEIKPEVERLHVMIDQLIDEYDLSTEGEDIPGLDLYQKTQALSLTIMRLFYRDAVSAPAPVLTDQIWNDFSKFAYDQLEVQMQKYEWTPALKLIALATTLAVASHIESDRIEEQLKNLLRPLQ